jgi:hypothetical protein
MRTELGIGLAIKSRHAIGVGQKCSRQNLQRNFSIQLRIRRTVHFTHAACPQLGSDAVMRDS